MGCDTIVLASASARRSQLLRQIGVDHRIVSADIDETPFPGETPADYVCRLAAGKAEAVMARLAGEPSSAVLAADTTVVLDGRIIGKPADEAECIDMLGALAGRTHTVLTAVVLARESGLRQALDASHVTFRRIEVDERRRYWASGEPAGKAGGYAIQGFGAVFVTRLEGSFSGVMGLPLYQTAQMLDAVGVRRWHST